MKREEEEDYMNDSLIPQDDQIDSYSKKRLKLLNKRENPKPKQLIQQEELDKSLSTKISSTNKGFKMLQKMGFEPTKSTQEPLTFQLKNDKLGIGNNLFKYETILEKREKEIKYSKKQGKFLTEQARKYHEKICKKDLIKMRNQVRKLDERNGQKKNIYWPPDEDVPCGIDGYSETVAIPNGDSPSVDQAGLSIENLSVEDVLYLVNNYLREQYFYCLYCGEMYKNIDDLNENCPGKERDDHDDL